jgi:hypothetical protein
LKYAITHRFPAAVVTRKAEEDWGAEAKAALERPLSFGDYDTGATSTNDGKHLRANMRTGARSRNSLLPLPRHHSMHADALDD